MALSQEEQQQVERGLAEEILTTHRPRSDPHGGVTTPLTTHRVCTWCVITWPCPRAEWALQRRPAALPRDPGPAE